MMESGNISIQSLFGSANASSDSHDAIDIADLTRNVICPVIAGFGVLGNLLNLALLSARYREHSTENLERTSLVGLITLAASDLIFCLILLLEVAAEPSGIPMTSKDLSYVYNLYSMYIKNLFIKLSTSYTMVIAICRYIGICFPLKARAFTSVKSVIISLLVVTVFWTSLMLPLAWTYEVFEFECLGNQTCFIFDLGVFMQSESTRFVLTNVWAILGFFLPIIVLSFCNVNLILSWRSSLKFQRATFTSICNSKRRKLLHKNESKQLQVTICLILLILTYTILVLPSEVRDYYSEISHSFNDTAVLVTNTLQVFHFSTNFLLYFASNSLFRGKVLLLFQCKFREVFSRGRKPGFSQLDVKSRVSLIPNSKFPSDSSISQSQSM